MRVCHFGAGMITQCQFPAQPLCKGEQCLKQCSWPATLSIKKDDDPSILKALGAPSQPCWLLTCCVLLPGPLPVVHGCLGQGADLPAPLAVGFVGVLVVARAVGVPQHCPWA